MAAQNTISCTTRGFVNALNWRQRERRLVRAGKAGTRVSAMKH
jgi:hypothetical protein